MPPSGGSLTDSAHRGESNRPTHPTNSSPPRVQKSKKNLGPKVFLTGFCPHAPRVPILPPPPAVCNLGIGPRTESASKAHFLLQNQHPGSTKFRTVPVLSKKTSFTIFRHSQILPIANVSPPVSIVQVWVTVLLRKLFSSDNSPAMATKIRQQIKLQKLHTSKEFGKQQFFPKKFIEKCILFLCWQSKRWVHNKTSKIPFSQTKPEPASGTMGYPSSKTT